MANVEKDAVTGQDTTGHEWDGIKELNTPLPRWWLYTFYACIVFSIGYWVVYPSWPSLSGYLAGTMNYSSRAEHAEDLRALEQSRSVWTDKFTDMSVDEIAADQQLLNYAMAGGRIIFAENCAPCHGSAGSGAPNYPLLADDDWIWGGTRAAIETTVRYGIRSGHDEARISDMPSFLGDEILNRDEIADVAEYVVSLSGGGDDREAAMRGQELYASECSSCHGENGGGAPDMGGPNLKDGIWLYGQGKDAVAAQISKPKHGVMPAWSGRLSDVAIKQVSLYVHSLGGGQ